MPIRLIGMIGVTPPKSAATLHIIEGGLSPNLYHRGRPRT